MGTGGPSNEAQCGPYVLTGRGRSRCRGGKLAERFLRAAFDLDVINAKTLAATPYTFPPLYAQVLTAGMATAGIGGGGIGGNSFDGAGGGGGTHGGQQGHSVGYGYDDAGNYNGPRFNPNLGTHPPHYGPGWDYDRGRRGRHGGSNGARGWNGGFRNGRF